MKDRRITRSQEMIKKSFLGLLSNKKIDEITINEITEKANVGRRTFYHHYLDKYDLMEQMIQEHINKLHDLCTVSQIGSSSNQELMWFSYFEENYDFFSIMLSKGDKGTFRDIFFNFIKDELLLYINDTGDIEKEIYITFCTSAIVGVIEYYFSQNSKEIDSTSFSNQVMALLDKLY